MLDPSQASFQLSVSLCVCRCVCVSVRDRDRARKWEGHILMLKIVEICDLRESVGVPSHVRTATKCAFESYTSCGSDCVISVCSGCSSKQWVSDRNVSAEQRSEDYKTQKIRYVVLVSVDPHLIKTFLSVFFFIILSNFLSSHLQVKPVLMSISWRLSLSLEVISEWLWTKSGKGPNIHYSVTENRRANITHHPLTQTHVLHTHTYQAVTLIPPTTHYKLMPTCHY